MVINDDDDDQSISSNIANQLDSCFSCSCFLGLIDFFLGWKKNPNKKQTNIDWKEYLLTMMEIKKPNIPLFIINLINDFSVFFLNNTQKNKVVKYTAKFITFLGFNVIHKMLWFFSSIFYGKLKSWNIRIFFQNISWFLANLILSPNISWIFCFAQTFHGFFVLSQYFMDFLFCLNISWIFLLASIFHEKFLDLENFFHFLD